MHQNSQLADFIKGIIGEFISGVTIAEVIGTPRSERREYGFTKKNTTLDDIFILLWIEKF